MALRRLLEREPIFLRRRLLFPLIDTNKADGKIDYTKETVSFPEESFSSPLDSVSSISIAPEAIPVSSTVNEKPDTGKTFKGQSDEAYCHECIEGHIMLAKTELRHALDRFRTSKEMTPGVVEKVRVAIQELQGIDEDIKNTKNVDDQTKKGLDDILDSVRWIRKDFGVSGRGLTRGVGSQRDLEELRDRVDKLQDQAYDLAENCPSCSEAVGLGYSLNLAKELGMPNADQLLTDLQDDRINAQEVLNQVTTYVQEKGTEEDVESLQEIKRLMYTPLKELEKDLGSP